MITLSELYRFEYEAAVTVGDPASGGLHNAPRGLLVFSRNDYFRPVETGSHYGALVGLELYIAEAGLELILLRAGK